MVFCHFVAALIKFGAYKSAWKDRDHSDPVLERVYYFDEFRVSRANQGSYDLVAPGGEPSQETRPMPPTLTMESS